MKEAWDTRRSETAGSETPGQSGARPGAGAAALACVACCLPLLAAAGGAVSGVLATWAGGLVVGIVAATVVVAAGFVVARRRRLRAPSAWGETDATGDGCSCCAPAGPQSSRANGRNLSRLPSVGLSSGREREEAAKVT